MVMHEINKHALYDHIWTPNPARAGPRATSATASPSCTAGGSTDTSAVDRILLWILNTWHYPIDNIGQNAR